MKAKNISNKVIGIGDVTILPGKTEKIPAGYENNPALDIYQRCKMLEITEKSVSKKAQAAEEEKKADDAETAEALRQARLASLDGIGEEALGRLAEELGINPADCKDQADVMKKVKAALKK